MEALLQVLLELLLELGGELFFDGVFRRTAADRKWLRFFFYAVLGMVLGALSLLVMPHHLLGSVWLRGAALALNPIVIALVMMRLGRWRQNRTSNSPYGLEAFRPAWALAFSFGLVRVLFAS